MDEIYRLSAREEYRVFIYGAKEEVSSKAVEVLLKRYPSLKIAGTVRRAPKWWCRNSLEWLYRLLCEPSRIRRQKVLPVFAWQVLKAKASYVPEEQQ